MPQPLLLAQWHAMQCSAMLVTPHDEANSAAHWQLAPACCPAITPHQTSPRKLSCTVVLIVQGMHMRCCTCASNSQA
jgi:hypothetical protein